MEPVARAFNAVVDGTAKWHSDWGWGLLLIVLTVVFHVIGLGLLNRVAVHLFNRLKGRRHSNTAFVVVMGAITMLATILHVAEVLFWSVSYLFLGAIADSRSATLYSLNAITSYGHESLFLEPQWQLLGAAEALNGWLLFGLTTAFLFSMFQRIVQPSERRD